jgi:large subunit ribosomal protein L4
VLVVVERGDDRTWLSLRNAPQVHLLSEDQLNTYDVLVSDDVVFTQAAFEAFVGRQRATADGLAAAGAERAARAPAGRARRGGRPVSNLHRTTVTS